MKRLILISFLSLSLIGFSQEKDTKLALRVANHTDFGSSDIRNYSGADLGLDFQNLNNDIYFYLSYSFNKSSAYKGNFLGMSFEYHAYNSQKAIRPFFRLSLLTEVSTNYKGGFLDTDSFFVVDKPTESLAFITKGYPYTEYSSNFYEYTPFMGTLSFGGDFLIGKNFHLYLSAGYVIKQIKYKQLWWKDNYDFRAQLPKEPIKSVNLKFLNFEMGLSCSFPFKK